MAKQTTQEAQQKIEELVGDVVNAMSGHLGKAGKTAMLCIIALPALTCMGLLVGGVAAYFGTGALALTGAAATAAGVGVVAAGGFAGFFCGKLAVKTLVEDFLVDIGVKGGAIALGAFVKAFMKAATTINKNAATAKRTLADIGLDSAVTGNVLNQPKLTGAFNDNDKADPAVAAPAAAPTPKLPGQ